MTNSRPHSKFKDIRQGSSIKDHGSKMKTVCECRYWLKWRLNLKWKRSIDCSTDRRIYPSRIFLLVYIVLNLIAIEYCLGFFFLFFCLILSILEWV